MAINPIYLRSLIALAILVICIDGPIKLTSALRTLNEPHSIEKQYVCPPSEAFAPYRCGVNSFRGELALDCGDRYLGDDRISDILDVFLSTPELSALPEIFLDYNNLTYVPHQLKSFQKLYLVLSNNLITSVEKDSLKYQVSESSVTI